MLRFLFGIFLLLICPLLPAQITASAEVDSNTVETGNPFTIRLYTPRSAGIPLKIDLSSWADIIPADNILSQSTPVHDEQHDAFRVDVQVMFFDADTFDLPPVHFRLNNGDSAISNPLNIMVYATPSSNDLAGLAPIKDIYREPSNWTDYAPWIAAIVGGILIILLLLHWMTRRPKTKVSHRFAALSPLDLARRKLADLEKQQLWQRGQVKAYYDELSHILREYWQMTHGFAALEMTTSEILSELKQHPEVVEHLSDAEYFFMQADLAKFAKGQPSADYHPKAFQQVSHWINKPVIQ